MSRFNEYIPVVMPKEGESVALHALMKKGTRHKKMVVTLERTIFVGKDPNDPTGGPNRGVAADAVLVAKTRDDNDKFFDRLLLDILMEAIHANPEGSPIVNACGEAALLVGKVPQVFTCLTCGSAYGETNGHFSRTSKFIWMVGSNKECFAKLSSESCSECYKRVMGEIGESRERAGVVKGKSIDTILAESSYESAGNDVFLSMVPNEVFDSIVNVVTAKLESIR